jgi:hypothetical protein
MCQLHISQQALPSRSLSTTTHRSNNWLNSRMCEAFLSGRIFRLQPDKVEKIRRRKNNLHHTIRHLWLSSHALRPQERRSNLSTDDAELSRKPNRLQHPSIHWRRGHYHEKRRVLISDLWKTFDNLDRYKLKLNPTKCSFGVSAGQILGFLVSARGIDANPEKIQAILTMGKPAKLHEVQQLAGRVAALSQFVARLWEKALPFYALIKKSDKNSSGQKRQMQHSRSWKSAFHTTSAGRTKRKRAIATIHRRYASGGKHGVSSRAKRRREGARSLATSILPQRMVVTTVFCIASDYSG